MYSVNIIGSHQRLDRAARKHLREISSAQAHFPSIREILKFEGRKGPDAIKMKSPAQDEPWHYYDPFDEDESGFLKIIEDHYAGLVAQLKAGNRVKVSFEAAWLAHALVDGITPAHHFPYEDNLTKLYGEGIENRTGKLKKVVIPGKTPLHMFKNNWKMWGAKGLLSTHMLFEGGAAFVILQMRHHFGRPTQYDIKTLQKIGLIEYFKRMAREVALMGMYERFYETGWTTKLAQDIRDELTPRMEKLITLAWHSALIDAGIEKPVLATVDAD